jgi:flagellar biosynthetic protein FliR
VFYQAIVMLIFLHMDVHYWLLRAIGDSFLYVPPSAGHLSGLFTLAVLNTCGRVFGLGVQIAAPVLAATLVTDIVLGLLSKASSQLPVMLLGPAVKTILGVLVLITTLKYWPDFFTRTFSEHAGERNSRSPAGAMRQHG